MKPRRYIRPDLKNKRLLYTVIAVCFVLGIVCGAVKANLLSGEAFENMNANLTAYINNLTVLEFSKAQIFAECLVKYGKTLLIIWFLSFIPPTAFISLLLIFAKGMSLGFTTASLIIKFGFTGLFYSTVLYLPQNLVLVWVYFFAAHNSLTTALNYIKGLKHGKKQDYKPMNSLSMSINFSRITENGVYILVGLACVALASLIETFVIPVFAAIFIG